MEKDGINMMVAIGGSAGSLELILKIIAEIPSATTATFLIILHRKNDQASIFENLVRNRSILPVKEVEDKDPILQGYVYIAPPDYHLLIEKGRSFSLDTSEKVHHSRPSIDVSFESVAEVFGENVVGVLLSGANADGARGLLSIKNAGGTTIVQDPSSAEVPYMPQQAIHLDAAEFICETNELPFLVKSLL